MGRLVDVNDLIDVNEVAQLLGLAQHNTITTYMRRYPDFPRPVIEFASGRCRSWVRQDVIEWRKQHKGRPRD